jgi:hypothetical protein
MNGKMTEIARKEEQRQEGCFYLMVAFSAASSYLVSVYSAHLEMLQSWMTTR